MLVMLYRVIKESTGRPCSVLPKQCFTSTEQILFTKDLMMNVAQTWRSVCLGVLILKGGREE
jgi:hypothetical protein